MNHKNSALPISSLSQYNSGFNSDQFWHKYFSMQKPFFFYSTTQCQAAFSFFSGGNWHGQTNSELHHTYWWSGGRNLLRKNMNGKRTFSISIIFQMRSSPRINDIRSQSNHEQKLCLILIFFRGRREGWVGRKKRQQESNSAALLSQRSRICFIQYFFPSHNCSSQSQKVMARPPQSLFEEPFEASPKGETRDE